MPNLEEQEIILDAEEQDILDSVERGEWRSIPNLEQELKRYQQIAKTQLSMPSFSIEELQTMKTVLSTQSSNETIQALLEKIERAIARFSLANNSNP